MKLIFYHSVLAQEDTKSERRQTGVE